MAYDTLNLWHTGGGCFEHAPQLSRVAEHQQGASFYITGDLQNLNVLLNEHGASIKGSLAKWYLGDNIQTLTRGDTQRAIEKLSDTLHLPLSHAKVKRLDVAKNFVMKQRPAVYFPYLGDCQHFKRYTRSTSLYYENGSRTKLFYDKLNECRAKGVALHNLDNDNLLRFELRFMQRLDRAFNVEEVTAQMLYDETFYMGLLDRWVVEYKNISKLTKMAFKKDVQLEPKDFCNQLLLNYIQLVGQPQVAEMVEEARKRGQFKRPEYASRTKAMLKELCQLETLTEPSELITELSSKILSVKNYYR